MPPWHRCHSLPLACLEPLEGGGPTEWAKQWKSGIRRDRAPKQLRLHVAGLTPDELTARMESAKGSILEPLLPNTLRHLERDAKHLPLPSGDAGGRPRDRLLAAMQARSDARAASGSSGPSFGWGGPALTMVWPQWENGFGDVIAHTLLPIAEHARLGTLPARLAVSGIKFKILGQLLTAVAPATCASERPNPPTLPRCNASCYGEIKLCALDHGKLLDAWEAAATLDVAMGFRSANESSIAAAVAASSSSMASLPSSADATAAAAAAPPVVRVLMAAREPHRTGPKMGERLVLNQEELLELCNTTTLELAGGGSAGGGSAGGGSAGGRVRLECELMPAGLPMPEQVAALQRAEVYVCMWGGDSIHALHLRRGAAVVEMVNSEFKRNGPWAWIGQHRRWITRHRSGGKEAPPPLRYLTHELNHSGSILTPASQLCIDKKWKSWRERRERDAAAAERNDSAAVARSRRAAKETAPGSLWDCFWNADMRVEWAPLRATLARAVADQRGIEQPQTQTHRRGRQAKG